MPFSSVPKTVRIGQALAAGMPFYGWYAVKHLDVTNDMGPQLLCQAMVRVMLGGYYMLLLWLELNG